MYIIYDLLLFCVAIPPPFIRCPSNSRHTLPKGENKMIVHISQPKTNVDWIRYIIAGQNIYDITIVFDTEHTDRPKCNLCCRQVTSFPSWGKQLHSVLTVGVTAVTFKARSSLSDYVASCRILVTVIGKQYNLCTYMRSFWSLIPCVLP